MWHRYVIGDAPQGITVEGDKNALPTRWWNLRWMIERGWKTVVVLEAQTRKKFRVGFYPKTGEKKIWSVPLHGHRFHVLVGREDCTFFAIDEKNNEVPLVFVARKTRDDVVPEDGPRL